MGTKPLSILIVDDQRFVAASIVMALGKANHVESVSSGREAFEILTAKPRQFDLLITDHMMPEWAGSELIRRLQTAAWQGKYMVLSGFMEPDVQAIYRGLGVEHILDKPFDVVELRRAVEQIRQSIQAAQN